MSVKIGAKTNIFWFPPCPFAIKLRCKGWEEIERPISFNFSLQTNSPIVARKKKKKKKKGGGGCEFKPGDGGELMIAMMMEKNISM